MKAIKRRLDILESVQRDDRVPLVLRMTDRQLVSVATGGKSETITNEELERIAAGGTYESA